MTFWLLTGHSGCLHAYRTFWLPTGHSGCLQDINVLVILISRGKISIVLRKTISSKNSEKNIIKCLMFWRKQNTAHLTFVHVIWKLHDPNTHQLSIQGQHYLRKISNHCHRNNTFHPHIKKPLIIFLLFFFTSLKLFCFIHSHSSMIWIYNSRHHDHHVYV